jgi:hypothetical protein
MRLVALRGAGRQSGWGIDEALSTKKEAAISESKDDADRRRAAKGTQYA